MIAVALRGHMREARALIREEGLGSYLRKSPMFLSRLLYRHQEHYIWRTDVLNLSGSFVPRIKDYEFKVVSEPEEMTDLLGAGLSFDPAFSLKDARILLREHVVGFLVLVHGELASWSWAALDEKTSYPGYNPPTKVDFAREAYVLRAFTLPRYRGLGLHTYGSFRRLQYLREKGKSGAILVTLKDNEPIIRVQERLGSRVCGEMTLCRVLLYEFWTEKWYDRR